MIHIVYSTRMVNNIDIHIYLLGTFLHEVIMCESHCRYIARNEPFMQITRGIQSCRLGRQAEFVL